MLKNKILTLIALIVLFFFFKKEDKKVCNVRVEIFDINANMIESYNEFVKDIKGEYIEAHLPEIFVNDSSRVQEIVKYLQKIHVNGSDTYVYELSTEEGDYIIAQVN